MRAPKYTLDEVRPFLREWTTCPQLAVKLGVTLPTAINYVFKLRKFLDSKVEEIPGQRGKAPSHYRMK